MKDIIKLAIILWIVKKLFLEDETAKQIMDKMKQKIKDFLK